MSILHNAIKFINSNMSPGFRLRQKMTNVYRLTVKTYMYHNGFPSFSLLVIFYEK